MKSLHPFFATNRAWWLAILLLALAAVFGGNRKSIQNRDPLFYAAVAAQMAEGGDLVVPKFDEDVYLKKPPLMMWLTAGSMKVLGVNDFSMKFPALLIGVIAILLTARLARLLCDRETALLVVLITVTSYSVLRSYRTFRLESIVTATTVGALLVYLQGCRRMKFPKWGGLAFFGLMAAGVMGKGYAGFMPLGLVVLGCPRKKALLSPWFWLGSVAFILPVGGWLLAVYRELGADWTLAFGADLQQYAQGEIAAGRFLDKMVTGFFKNNLPWTAFFAIGVVMAVGSLVRRGSGERGRSWLLLLWILLICGASITKEKSYTRYLVPAWPAVALLAAIPIRNWFRGRDYTPLVAISTSAVVLFALLYFFLPLKLSRDPYPFVNLASTVQMKVPEDERLAVVGPLSPGRRSRIMLFLGRRPIRIPTRDAVSLSGTKRLVLLYKEARPRLPEGARFTPIHRDREFSLGYFE